MDTSLLLSLGSHVDVYYPPLKRSRVTALAPFVFAERFLKPKKSSLDVLPDECLFEIFRRLPPGQEKSACSSVSKRWLMLLSGICRVEVSTNTPVSLEDVEGDGYLTRCLEGKKAIDIRLAAMPDLQLNMQYQFLQ